MPAWKAFFCLPLLLAAAAFAEDPVKIGVSVPLTGDASTYGYDIRNAAVFAADTLAPKKYQLVIEDDQCSERHAISAAQKLVTIDKVKYVIGFGCSGALLAAAPIYEKAKVVVIAPATGAPAITQAGDYIFRTIPSLATAASKLYGHAFRKHKAIAILSEETAYAQGLKDAFLKENSAHKLEINTENFLPGTTDFRTTLAKLRARGVTAVFINPQSESGFVTIYSQLLGMNWRVQVYGTYYPGSPDVLKAFGSRADGIIYADLPFNEQLLNDRGLKMYADFEAKFGPAKSGEFNITLTYAAFNALHQAIESGQDVKSYLYSSKFGGIIDGYSFDKNGDVVSGKITFVLKLIAGGKPVPCL